MLIHRAAAACAAATVIGVSLCACNSVEDDQASSARAAATEANSSASHSSTVNPTNPADPPQTPAAGQNTTP